MKTRGERLVFAMEAVGMGVNELDRQLGKGGTGFTSRLRRDGKGKRTDTDSIHQIAEILGIRFEWLEWGRGEMKGETVTELEAMLAGTVAMGLAPGQVELSNFDLATRFYRNTISPAAIERVRANAPDRDLSPEQIGDMLVEEQQKLNRVVTKKATEAKAVRVASDARAATQAAAEAKKRRPKSRSA